MFYLFTCLSEIKLLIILTPTNEEVNSWLNVMKQRS